MEAYKILREINKGALLSFRTNIESELIDFVKSKYDPTPQNYSGSASTFERMNTDHNFIWHLQNDKRISVVLRPCLYKDKLGEGSVLACCSFEKNNEYRYLALVEFKNGEEWLEIYNMNLDLFNMIDREEHCSNSEWAYSWTKFEKKKFLDWFNN